MPLIVFGNFLLPKNTNKIYILIKNSDFGTESVLQEWQHLVFKWGCWGDQWFMFQQTWKHPVFPVEVTSDFSRLWNTLCLCLPVKPANAVLKLCPKSLATDFAFAAINCIWKSLQKLLSGEKHRLKLRLKNELSDCCLSNIIVLSPLKPQINCVKFKELISSF